MDSKVNSLNKLEIQRWIQETIIFTSPTLIIFISSLLASATNGQFPPNYETLMFALGAAYKSLLDSLLNLFGKYKEGK